jgi:hypothetical protein
LVQGGEKAAERRTGRQTVAPKERHEGLSPGLYPLVKGFQRAFAADGIAEEHGHKIKRVVPSETLTGKVHLVFNSGKHALSVDVVNDQSDFPEPAGQGGN